MHTNKINPAQHVGNPSDQSSRTGRHPKGRSTNKLEPNRLTARSATCPPPRYYSCRRRRPACDSGRCVFRGRIGQGLVCRGADGVDDFGDELNDLIERLYLGDSQRRQSRKLGTADGVLLVLRMPEETVLVPHCSASTGCLLRSIISWAPLSSSTIKCPGILPARSPIAQARRGRHERACLA